MAVGGAQSVPGVSMHEAYRFDGDGFEGFVYKVGKMWEARALDTPIRVKGETRKEAVELAIRQRGAAI